jgi:hypothetical protein
MPGPIKCRFVFGIYVRDAYHCEVERHVDMVVAPRDGMQVVGLFDSDGGPIILDYVAYRINTGVFEVILGHWDLDDEGDLPDRIGQLRRWGWGVVGGAAHEQ